MVQICAMNETNVVLSGMSTFSTLLDLLACIERTFSDPDWERMEGTQLHTLKMTTRMMEDEYTAKFASRKDQFQ